MPFTLAHLAIVLPLKRAKPVFSTTAIVAGSMVPDFENFLQLRQMQNTWHHWYGIMLFDFPVGLLACYLFHNLLKLPFISNLPSGYRKRFESSLYFNWNSFVSQNKRVVFLSLVTGILIHICWDGFTHKDGIFVLMIPLLSATIHIVKYNFTVHFVLQIISSIMGLLVLQKTMSGIPLKSAATALIKNNFYYWPSFLIIIFLIISIRLLVWPEFNMYLGVLKACMGAILYAWLLVSVIFKIVK